VISGDPPFLLYLDQNYLSGIAKRKPAFRELEPVLFEAVASGAVRVPEAAAHRAESAPRPDLELLPLLRRLSTGARLPDAAGGQERNVEKRLRRYAAEHFPQRIGRPSDEVDLRTLAIALPRCRLIACDAFMADVIRRAGLDRRFGCDVFGGRRHDVLALRDRLATLSRRGTSPAPG
jgi:hypothetical protein